MQIHTTTPRFFGHLLFMATFGLAALFLPQQAAAQRFKAGIIAGVTASQIDGDASAGYNKVGLQGGFRGIALLRPKQDLSMELLFTQRGARSDNRSTEFFKTTLNYIEVPLQWHYHDWPANGDRDKPDFHRIHFNLGMSYARLLGYQNDEGGTLAGIAPALPDLNRNSFCFLVGVTLFASEHVGFTFRYHRAVNRLYDPFKSGAKLTNSLNEHFLAFQTLYVF